VLYVSYNGIAEPLVRSQVLNYLEGLSRRGYRFVLITFERGPVANAADWREKLLDKDIEWHAVTASRGFGPLSSLIDVARGIVRAHAILGRRHIALFHARSFIPALIGRWVRTRRGVPLLNDIRGFWIDEKVYKGSLRAKGPIYRVAKRLEAWVLTGSDAIVSLADTGQVALRGFECFRKSTPPPMTTIPTCVDLELHRRRSPRTRQSLVVGYVGSMSDDYLPDQICRFFLAVRRRHPDARLHLVTKSEPLRIGGILQEFGVPAGSVVITNVSPDAVPAEIEKFDIALSLIRPGFAKLASCPTKVGEYLAAGVPVVSNSGIGDLDALISENRIGWILSGFDTHDIDRALDAIAPLIDDPELADRCRSIAEQHFSLPLGVARYAGLYDSLIKGATR
jgi:glycosyltransferase involved in cell wall biosynthesis